MNVLFLCTGNSCRSILAEAIFNHLAPDGWAAMSAGSQPTGFIHPRSVTVLKKEGIKTEGYFSKSWNNLEKTPDIVISVCANAENEYCPIYLGAAIRSHWGVSDPAHAVGTDEQINQVFYDVYSLLRSRIETFFALPLDVLIHDKYRLKKELDKIAAQVI